MAEQYAKYIKLKMIDKKEHNNKQYEIFEDNNGNVSVKWGAIGTTPRTTDYGHTKTFEELKDAKIRKGYVIDDSAKQTVTSQVVGNVKYDEIDYKPINDMVTEFLRRQRQMVAQNFSVKVEHITQKQVDDAKFYFEELQKARNNQFNNPTKNLIDAFNQVLYKENMWNGKATSECLLFVVERRIPQSRVDTLLLNVDSVPMSAITLSANQYQAVIKQMDDIIEREEKLITALEGEFDRYQQTQKQLVKPTNVKGKKETVLDANGLKMDEITYKDEDMVMDLLRVENFQGLENLSRYQFGNAFKVEVEKTQSRFDKYCKDNDIKKKSFLWHGSITENLWSITTKGLKIMPNAANGRAFGNGIYFADKSQKSANYISARPNRKNGKTSVSWNHGNDDHGYLALFEVATGKPLKVSGWGSSESKQSLKNKGYDCLYYISNYNQTGQGFRDNEIVVYDEAQCTLKYLVKIDSDPHPYHYHLNPSFCNLTNGVTELVKENGNVYGVLDITALSDKDRNYWAKKFNTTSADTVKIYTDKIVINDKEVNTYQDGKDITADDKIYLFREVKKNFFEKESEYADAIKSMTKDGVVKSKVTNDSLDEHEEGR